MVPVDSGALGCGKSYGPGFESGISEKLGHLGKQLFAAVLWICKYLQFRGSVILNYGFGSESRRRIHYEFPTLAFFRPLKKSVVKWPIGTVPVRYRSKLLKMLNIKLFIKFKDPDPYIRIYGSRSKRPINYISKGSGSTTNDSQSFKLSYCIRGSSGWVRKKGNQTN